MFSGSPSSRIASKATNSQAIAFQYQEPPLISHKASTTISQRSSAQVRDYASIGKNHSLKDPSEYRY